MDEVKKRQFLFINKIKMVIMYSLILVCGVAIIFILREKHWYLMAEMSLATLLIVTIVQEILWSFKKRNKALQITLSILKYVAALTLFSFTMASFVTWGFWFFNLYASYPSKNDDALLAILVIIWEALFVIGALLEIITVKKSPILVKTN